ncbi:hypothetical protein N7488_000433 [Penicillium malachiteum]|nr:hypothetical protein N7488_000433 [Penicillium malachiteum]
MAHRFNVLPEKIPGNPTPFTFHVPEDKLIEFRELLRLSKVGAVTWWNQQGDPNLGVSREWLAKAKETWLTSFDWRKHEDFINKFPNFEIILEDNELGQVNVHFAALFSAKKDAIPVIFMHGYPSTFVDFLPMMEILAEKYSPETLPYHVIVPSLPDYGLSDRQSLDQEMTLGRSARIMNQLMIELGFHEGYVAQGGDLGSMLARMMSARYKECKAFHVNMLVLNEGQEVPSPKDLSPQDLQILQRTEAWSKTGLAYVLEHGTRPSTVGLAISSSPLALLAWIGEKLMEWTDPQNKFSLDQILSLVSFYWLTDTFPRSLYHATIIRDYIGSKPFPTSMEKPLGYSMFQYDLAVLPQPWVQELYPNLVFFNNHDRGGHFASIEQPDAFLDDVEKFVSTVSGLFKAK